MERKAYKIVEIVGTSDTSWEDAARSAVETAEESLRDLRVAEVSAIDMTVRDGKVQSYRARVDISFKHHTIIKKIKNRERPEEVSD